MNISLKQLKVFVGITQHNTLTAASESLFLSKAAVSMALSELEKQLGHPLFDRVNHRLILNQEGQKLLPLADELLHRANDINTLFSSHAKANGTLKIGASDTIGNHVLPSILSGFRQQQQHYSQQVFISNSELICQKLRDFELDIALIEGHAQQSDLISTVFSQDTMCIIAPLSHTLAAKPQLSFNDLANSQWVLREAGSGSRSFFLQNLATHIDNWSQSFELNTTEALINSVAEGLGLGCLSSLAAQYALNDGRVTQLNLNHPMQRQFWLVMHKDKYKNPLLTQFIDFCVHN
ncbi:LysR substrate-binding domain-containing protein [Pseudoalteromonas sp. S4741]|uniref:LysR substrate-binding domain-containing protein n=1 Tax=Pseudoalteromonas sp. S4741 TaxID=579563 RepID=UPI00110AA248|nr:LysR substrate-binding domain-containing protein [Pseudoalteromonas sp. S4741]TMO21699.1 LysR family transcriptional regulator [Pseudoalteromonas sp. S4741]